MKYKNKIQKILIDSACHFEYLYNFIGNVKDVYPDISEAEIKRIALTVIKILLKKKILSIHNYSDESQWNLPVDESIKKIDEMWFKGASYIDFIHMIFFKRQDWFYEKLKKEGYSFIDNWVEYVNKNPWLQELLKIDDNDLK